MSNVIDLSRPENILSGKIIDISLKIHKKLGPGLLENVYEVCLVHLLQKEGISVERQKTFGIKIDDLQIPMGFRADLVVENCVICEIKSIDKLLPIHTAQIMTYLKLSGIRTGLLINFNTSLLN